MKDPFCPFGPPELCTWRYAPGICRFQTTDPQIARKLSSRRSCKLVMWSVAGGYLKVFQERMPFGRAKQLVTRYLMRPNEGFWGLNAHLRRAKLGQKERSAENKQKRSWRLISRNSDMLSRLRPLRATTSTRLQFGPVISKTL